MSTLVHALVGEGTALRVLCDAPDAQQATWQATMVTCPPCLARLGRPTQKRPPSLFPDEQHFQADLIQAARRLGWRAYHPWTAQHSEEGYPDTTLIRAERLLVLELKMPGKQATPAQEDWIDAFTRVRTVEARVVWPEQWDWILAQLQR